MNLSVDTQKLMEQVEDLTAKPVHLIADPELPSLANVKIARGSAPVHLVSYRPGALGTDYALASQLGSILRVYQAPLQERADFVFKETGRDSVRKSLAGPNGTLKPYNLPEAVVKTATDAMFDGLMTQLRSLPIEMRVSIDLRAAYPGLHDAQERFFADEHKRAAQALSPQVRTMTPPTIFSGNAAMNAAYALFCDRLLNRPLYGVAYRSTGLADRGQALLDLWDQTPFDAAYDRTLVDAWGNELGLTDWYTWTPWQ